MYVWKVKFAYGQVSAIVNNSYTVMSESLSGALKKAKRLDDQFVKEIAESGDEPEGQCSYRRRVRLPG